jgi:hypothetical protein
MSNIRFAGIALALLVVGYVGVQWLMAPKVPTFQGVDVPKVPTFQRVDVNSARYKYESSYASDSDARRDELRHAALDTAIEFGRNACDATLKARYIDAATKYARAWVSIAPCVATSTCTSSDRPRLDRAQQAFGSPLDRRVREAMRNAHETGRFDQRDFPTDILILLAEMAADPMINPEAALDFKELARDLRNEKRCSEG